MALYLPKFNILFVHIPKSGGTAIKHWFEQNFSTAVNFKNLKHANLHEIKSQINLEDETSFTIVRNPWSRAVSAFFYEQKIIRDRINLIKKNHPKIKPWKEKWKLEHNEKLLEEYNHGLKYYLENTTSDLLRKQQIEYTKDVNLIFKLEELKTKFKVIQKMVNCNAPLGIHNSSKHEHYTNYYDKKTKRIIEKRFKDDIENWGYTFGD